MHVPSLQYSKMFLQKQNTLPVTNQTISSLSHHANQLQLEQNCLFRLKQQRVKVQQLTLLCQQQQRQLHSQRQQIGQLQLQLEQLSTNSNYMEAYQQLKGEYQQLFGKYEQSQQEYNVAVKEQQSMIAALEDEVQQAKINERRAREDAALNEANLNSILEDKEQSIIQLERELSRQNCKHEEQLQKWRKKCDELKHLYEQKKEQHRSTQKQSRKTSRAKDVEIDKMRRQLSIHQNEFSRNRLKATDRQHQQQLQREQMRDSIEHLNMIVTSLRKELTQKIMENEGMKEKMGKMEVKCHQLQDYIESVCNSRQGSKHCKRQREEQRYGQAQREKRYRLEGEVERLKCQIRMHIDDYNLIQSQLRKWKGLADNRQHSVHTRRHLCGSSCS